MAKTEGPQRVTVHGREEVVIVSAEEYRRTEKQPTGEALVQALHDSPPGDIDFDRPGTKAPVRGIDL